jgi:hypothetical protein
MRPFRKPDGSPARTDRARSGSGQWILYIVESRGAAGTQLPFFDSREAENPSNMNKNNKKTEVVKANEIIVRNGFAFFLNRLRLSELASGSLKYNILRLQNQGEERILSVQKRC